MPTETSAVTTNGKKSAETIVLRELGVPTVMDRVIEQAITQIITPMFEPSFHENSYGYKIKKRLLPQGFS